MQVFYRQNRFVIYISASTGKKHCGNDESVIFPFLQWFPGDSIGLFTSLTLSFESFRLQDLLRSQSRCKNWEEAIELLSERANLPALRLEIRLFESYYPSSYNERLEDLDIEYEKVMLDTYDTLFRPMVALRGLKALYIHLNWQTSDGRQDGRQVHEQRFERMIMGEEYDAWNCGKRTQWLDPSIALSD